MHIRRLEIVLALFALVVGAAMPVSALTGAAGSFLVTFLGFVSASILPTITLLLSSMSAGGRSVMALGELHLKLRDGIRTLFLIFGWAAAAVATLVVLALPTPSLLTVLPFMGELISRTLQGLALMLTTLTVLKARAIPNAIHQCLDLMADIATDSARRRTAENAPKEGDTMSTFKTAEGFGRVRSLEELHTQDPH